MSILIKGLEMPTDEAVALDWLECEVFSSKDVPIDEWQSAKCPYCGKYHTTPYVYYFEHYRFCPNCGAKMGGIGDV